MKEIPEMGRCSLCGGTYQHWGNNPAPLGREQDRCCDACNSFFVIPARLAKFDQMVDKTND